VMLAALALGACSSDSPAGPGGSDGGSGGIGGTGGSGGTGGEGGGGSGGTENEGGSGGTDVEASAPKVNELERLGGYVPASPSAALAGVNEPLLIVGHRGTYLESVSLLGLAEQGSAASDGMSSGLVILDTDTGKLRLYTAADGLPTMVYPDSGVTGTSAFLDLAWIRPDERFAAAAWNQVVVGEVDAGGAWTFQSQSVRGAGAEVDAMIIRLAVVGDELFLATDQGIVVLDAGSLSTKRWIDLGAEEPHVFELVAATLDGPVVVIAWNPNFVASAPDRISVVAPGASSATLIPLPEGSLPTAFAGTTGAAYIGTREGDGTGAILALVAGDEGPEFKAVVPSNALAEIHGTSIVPNRIAVDEVNQRLFVGGQFTATQPANAAGIGAFELIANATVSLPGRSIVDRRRQESSLLPWQTELLVPDAQGRLYVGGRQLCSEFKTRATGVYRIENITTDPEDSRMVRPWVNGVRAIEVDPVDGNTWLGLRNENPGLQCDGLIVQQNVCRLKADGSCEIYAPRTGVSGMPTSAGARSFAFGDPDAKEFAYSTLRNGTFVRKGERIEALRTQIEPGISLEQTAAAWGESGLWLGSGAGWSKPPENDQSGIDWDKVNDRSPHGLGYLEFDADGDVTFMRRYSRNQADNKDYDVPGMPSNAALDVLPLPGPRHALVALGLERQMWTYDHILPDARDPAVGGGLVEIEDDEIHTIAPPDGLVFGDVVGLAAGADGSFFALDATNGVIAVDLESRTSSLFARPAWGSKARGTSLAVDGEGRVAVGTTIGLYVFDRDGNVTTAVSTFEHGGYWALRFMEDGVLYAGSDQGLVRVAIDEVEELPARLGPEGPLARTLWPLERGEGCYGAEGCVCEALSECAPGSVCDCSGAGPCVCSVPKDPCLDNPGDVGCACTDDSTCNGAFACVCEGASCACQPDPEGDECLRSCGCGEPEEGEEDEVFCPDGTRCLAGLSGAMSCVPGDESGFNTCMSDCSCPGSGCPDTYTCESSILGPRCVPVDPNACLANCSCGVNDGCFDGYRCQGGIFGKSCVEEAPVNCQDDCSCETESGCEGELVCVEGSCAEDPGPANCEDDCSCETDNGCLEGNQCTWTETGSFCEEAPPACLVKCRCETESGCPDGYTCVNVGGFVGTMCQK